MPLRHATISLKAVIAAGCLSLLLLTPLFGKTEPISKGERDEAYSSVSLLTQVLQLIRQDYIDGNQIGYHDLIYDSLQGMLSNLDPHSSFLDPEEFKRMQDSTKSQTNFGGLGIVVSMKDEAITVISAFDGSPSARAGLLSGDQIIKIDEKSTEDMSLNQAVDLLRGEPGQAVEITVLRPATKEIIDFQLVREIIKIPSVKNVTILPQAPAGNARIGYALITQFNDPTDQQLAEQLSKIEQQGIDALILDLRNNPGGLLESAIAVCELFLPENTLVVSTEGRKKSQKKVYKTSRHNRTKAKTYPLAILVNGGSASGSEIVAGALKDLNRAIVIGETTFGKGSVQSVIQLSDNSAIKLTTAKYYTPSKKQIHEVGVTPHILATTTIYEERILSLLRNREEIDPEQIEKYNNIPDIQLNRAIDALNGLLIYRRDFGKL